MTAEVAIMNKLGMAMAADSAITSGRDGVKKVYNSANKLFSLSKEQSVGIMVYGSASFMETPWDVIIKSYRKYLGDRTFSNLTYYMEDFLDFLRHDERFKSPEMEEVIVYRLFSDVMKRLVREVEDSIEASDEGVTNERVTEWLTDCVEREIEHYHQKEEDFLDIEYQAFKEKFYDIIKEIKEELISFEIPDSLKESMITLAYELARKDYFSIGSTGFVMAGYGNDEIFPHLLDYRLEGFVLGRLKYKEQLERKISYSNNQKDGTATITPFAQKEMIDSFIEGMEPNMRDAVFNIVSKVLDNYPDQIQKHLSISFSDDEVTELENLGKDIYQSIGDAVEEYQDKHYIRPLLGIVRSLPKEELAEMAEALINLTSFKRRVSRVTESVGPPIDVAVITKGDGFIWMKRKNHVDSEINSRF